MVSLLLILLISLQVDGHISKSSKVSILVSNVFCLYRYVFTRLKWLKSKALSHLVTLLFLAMWHGLWPGYFITFLLEFILIVQERQVSEEYIIWSHHYFSVAVIM